MPRQRTLLLLVLLLFFAAAGCARAGDQHIPGDASVALEVSPNPPAVGEATLTITLRDAAGEPIEDATLDVKGDMSHAGMAPVLAQAEGGAGGVYEVPFRWTMGGDWFVTVEATLADGTVITRRFDLSVGGDHTMP